MGQVTLPYPLKGPIFILYSPAQEKVGHFRLTSPGDWPFLHPPEHLDGPHWQELSEDLMWMIWWGAQVAQLGLLQLMELNPIHFPQVSIKRNLCSLHTPSPI